MIAPDVESSNLSFLSCCQGNGTAVLIDFENVAGLETTKIGEIVNEAKSDGWPLIARAYADWQRYSTRRRFLADLGIELVELPSNRAGKNSADMQLTVDSLEIAASNCLISKFVFVTGDRDFVPVIRQLRRWGRTVWTYLPEDRYSPQLAQVSNQYFVVEKKTKNLPSPTTPPVPSKSSVSLPTPASNAPVADMHTVKLTALALHALETVYQADAGTCQFELAELVEMMMLIDSTFVPQQAVQSIRRPQAKLAARLAAARALDITYNSSRTRILVSRVDDSTPIDAALLSAQETAEAIRAFCQKHRRLLPSEIEPISTQDPNQTNGWFSQMLTPAQ